MSFRKKEGAKITIGTIFVSLSIVCILWLCLFITDYVMYKNNKPTLFSIVKVQEIEGKHVTYERGLGYYVYVDANGVSEMYLLGRKIK